MDEIIKYLKRKEKEVKVKNSYYKKIRKILSNK